MKVKCIGVPNIVVEHGAPNLIKRDLKLDPEGMFETIYSFVSGATKTAPHDNGSKSSSGNGNRDLEKDVKKPIITREPING